MSSFLMPLMMPKKRKSRQLNLEISKQMLPIMKLCFILALANELQKAGYQIERNEKHFEVKGL
jgi:uncharacterized protein YvpB